jgi:hypothetical protein
LLARGVCLCTCVYVGFAPRPCRGEAPREPLPDDSSFSSMAGPLAAAGAAAGGGKELAWLGFGF